MQHKFSLTRSVIYAVGVTEFSAYITHACALRMLHTIYIPMYVSLISRPSTPPVFERLQYAVFTPVS